MPTDPRPLVVLTSPLHPDGHALLESEARALVCEEETEAGFAEVAADAQGILFRIRPRCSQMAVQVAGEMLRVLRGERPIVLVNPDVWSRLGQR